MGAHAKTISPSNCHRTLHCTASVALCANLPDTSSSYADDGTATHALIETCINVKKDAKNFIGTEIMVGETRYLVDEERAERAQFTLDYARREGEGKLLSSEQRIPLTPLTGEPEAYGTADVTVIDGDTVTIIDHKDGMTKVEAEDNEQCLMLAAAAREEYSLVGNYKKFKGVISQPRCDSISEFEFTDKELDAFVARIKQAAKNIATGNMQFAPSEHVCRWCKAKAICPALKEQVMTAVAKHFDDLSSAPEVDVSDSMMMCDMVEDWVRAVRAEVERRLLSGKPVKGWKLVAGRRGARQWTDANQVEEVMKKQMRLSDDEMYKKSLISPTQAEKALKEQPRRWMTLQEFIQQKEGAPSVAPESDDRPALIAVTDGFEDLDQKGVA